MTRLRAALTALALAVTVLLTGCSQGAPASAAIVNGVVIHESTVNELTDALTPIAVVDGQPVPRDSVRSQVLNALVLGEVSRHVASQQKLSLGSPDFGTLAANPNNAPLIATEAGRRYITDAYGWAALRNQLTTQDVLGNITDSSLLEAALATESVELNPRYGTWYIATAAGRSAPSSTTGSLSELSAKK